MAGDLRGGGADGGVITLQPFERLLFERAGKESAFQRVQLARYVVVLVKVAVVKHLGKNLFRQDVLNQHLAHIGIAQQRVDGLLRVQQKPLFGGAEFSVAAVRLLNHAAQCGQHGGQIGFELLHSAAEIGNLRALIAKKQLEQFLQGHRVVHRAAHHLLAVLPQHASDVVAKDDVVLRIAFFEFLDHFRIQVVLRVFGFPIAHRHAQRVQ